MESLDGFTIRLSTYLTCNVMKTREKYMLHPMKMLWASEEACKCMTMYVYDASSVYWVFGIRRFNSIKQLLLFATRKVKTSGSFLCILSQCYINLHEVLYLRYNMTQYYTCCKIADVYKQYKSINCTMLGYIEYLGLEYHYTFKWFSYHDYSTMNIIIEGHRNYMNNAL